MSASLQVIVDELASRLGRPAAVDDAQLRDVLAFSAHDAEEDAVRRDSILRRRVMEPARRWAVEQGVLRAETLMTLPPNPALEMQRRIVAPIVWEGERLGFLFVTDADASLSPAQLEMIRTAADDAAAALHREHLLDQLTRGQERELIRDLLTDNEQVRRAAVAQLLDLRLVTKDGPALTAILTPRGDPADKILTRAAETAVRALGPNDCLHLQRADHAVLITRVAANASGALSRLRAAANDQVIVGVGEVVPSLHDVHKSHHQAQAAVRVGMSAAALGNVLEWSRLGVYRTLAAVDAMVPLDDLLPRALVELRQGRDWQRLSHTLETWLDTGCDPVAAAAALSIHRGTLYHRLRRIQQLTGSNLADGHERLTVHLGLKLLRFRDASRP